MVLIVQKSRNRCANLSMKISMFLAAVLAALLTGAHCWAQPVDTQDSSVRGRHGRHHGGQGDGGGSSNPGTGAANIRIQGGSPPASPYPAGDDRGSSQVRPRPVWYYCAKPAGYFPYIRVCEADWQRREVLPPPPHSPAPISESMWKRCGASAAYFPYHPTCDTVWADVIPSNPVPSDDPDGIAVVGDWSYCEDRKDYWPYASACDHAWRSIPSIPPPVTISASADR